MCEKKNTLKNPTLKIHKEKTKVILYTSIPFPRQSLKIFTFRVKLSDSIFFLLGHSPIVKLI